MKLSKLKPNPHNPRVIKDAKFEQLKTSLQNFPRMMELRPIVIDDDGTILGGNMRFEALKALNHKDIPDDWVKNASDLTEEQKQEFIIKDNVGFGEWDWDRLANEWDENLLQEWGLDIPDFTSSEEEEDSRDAPPQMDLAEELNKKWKVSAGDIWQVGNHQLLCGDSTKAEDVALLLDGNKPALMVTDPPYGVEYDPAWRAKAGMKVNSAKMGKVLNDDRADWTPTWQLAPATVAYIWHAGRYASEVQSSLQIAGYGIVAQIIWAKDKFALSRGDYHWKHEPCWYAVRSGEKHLWNGARDQHTLWEIPRADDEGHGHGTQKPLECMSRPIRNHQGDVYEPFAGSGTTLVAAQNLKRKCYAIEIHPPYCAIILERMKTAFPELEIKRLAPSPKQKKTETKLK